MVTVDPATGFAVLRWLPSASTDVMSYTVHIYSEATSPAFDTVSSSITEYTHTASAARYQSVTYVVAAIDSSLNVSPLSNPLSTVWLLAVNDECTGRITVAWAPYENEYHPATGQVLHITDMAGTIIGEPALSPTEAAYIFSGYEPDTEYCFHITAIDAGGPLSSSNRACVTTGSEVAPEWVTIDAIVVENGGLTVTAGYDQATDMENFRLQLYNGATSSWDEAGYETGSSGRVTFPIQVADTSVINLFRAEAVNSCGLESTLSEPARNMVAQASVKGTHIDLQWNRPGAGGTELFTVWRDTGAGPKEIAGSLSDTLWSDDYSCFAMEVNASAIVYRVTARDPSASPDLPAHRSSAAVIRSTENIYMPNAFTPGRGIENAIFRPEFSFLPGGYDFRIYTRNGAMLFSTTNHGEGWDGTNNGTPMPPGVYLWTLRISMPSGRTEVMSGTVTILP
jgi:gliding motility-associated-like protein